MGIDNESKFIFGVILEEPDITKVYEKLGQDIFYGEEENEFDLFFGYTNGWYDCCSDGMTYYISIIEPENTSLSISEMKELIDNWESSKLKDCLDYCGIEGIEYTEPSFHSLHHVC